MAQPKRRWSKARTGKLEEENLSTCSHCHQPVRPHTVCANCGYYDGKEVIAKKASND